MRPLPLSIRAHPRDPRHPRFARPCLRIVSLAALTLLSALPTPAAEDDGGDSGAVPTLERWIADLGSSDFETRREAMRQLGTAEGDVIPLLRKAAADPDPERATRARLLLERRLRHELRTGLQGDWRFVEVVEDGKPNRGGLETILRFEGDTCRFITNRGDKYEALRVVLGVVHEPVHFDLVLKGQTSLGLVRLDGDRLEITYGLKNDQPRPAAIDPSRTEGLRYFRLERHETPEP